jgi:hypothetical protein
MSLLNPHPAILFTPAVVGEVTYPYFLADDSDASVM